MFIACPHCRELVAPHPLTRQLPPICPRCGGNLPGARPLATAAPAQAQPVSSKPDSAAAPSLVTLLRPANAGDPASAPALAGEGIAASVMAAHPASADTTTTAASSAVVTPADEATTDIAAGPVASPPAQADIAADSPAPSAAATDTDNTPADAAGTDPATAVESAAVVPASEAPPASAPAEASRASGHPASPSFLQRRRSARPSPSPARWQWAVVVVLATLLVLQVLLADRERLAADAAWRPLIGGLCGVLGCSMPAWREPQALTMINRDVRPLPQVPGVLLAKATFRNDARWAQPWPVLLLTLKDADGRSLGARALLPADYLDAAASADIAPGQTAEITVRVREPSASVVAFAFDFH